MVEGVASQSEESSIRPATGGSSSRGSTGASSTNVANWQRHAKLPTLKLLGDDNITDMQHALLVSEADNEALRKDV